MRLCDSCSAERGAAAERRPLERRVDVVLVQRRARPRASPRRRRASRPRGSSVVIRMSDVPSDDANGCATGSMRQLPSRKPKRPSRTRCSSLCASTGKWPWRHESSTLLRDASAISGTSPSLQPGEDLAHLGGLHPRLEVVEQRVVGLVDLEARRRTRRRSSMLRSRCGRKSSKSFVRRASTQTGNASAPARVCSSRSSAGTLQLLVAVAAGDPDQARLVRVVVERLLVRPELLEQLAELLRDDQARGRASRPSPSCWARTAPPAGGIIACWSQRGEPPSLTRSQISASRPRSSS